MTPEPAGSAERKPKEKMAYWANVQPNNCRVFISLVGNEVWQGAHQRANIFEHQSATFINTGR
jgi:hypothetical protein